MSAYTPRTVITAYLVTSLLNVLATSVIWATNTIFLIEIGGLTIFEVMLVNTSFTVAQMLFEVPTGVIADTIGRKASLLLGIGVIAVSTVLYVATPAAGWGIAGFIAASVLLGLGFTFQTGAGDAWLVDALDHTGYTQTKERVFSWGQMTFGAGMLIGSILGGLLGQLNLAWPFYLRATLLVGCLLATALLVKDLGFQPRPLRASSFGAETRTILEAGARYGWGSPVVRPLLFTSALGGVFFLYGFYTWAPYLLELLGGNRVWVLGFVQAAWSVAGIGGNALVPKVMGAEACRRHPATVLAVATSIQAAIAAGIALVGVFAREPGLVPAGVAIALWLGWGVVFGVFGPVRAAFINEHIPSAQRATVLSLDAFFADAGGAVGQPSLGWVSDRLSIPVGWFIGGLAMLGCAPLFLRSGAAARAEKPATG